MLYDLFGTEIDEDLDAYKRMLRRDPCAYCMRAGGTVDHIHARNIQGAERHDPTNMTGACVSCNHNKDKGSHGGHRTILHQLLAVDEVRRREVRAAVQQVGAVVSGPFFTRGTVRGVYLEEPTRPGATRQRVILVDVPGRQELWPCYAWSVLKLVSRNDCRANR